MDISKHLEKMREGIAGTIVLADDATKEVASRVASAAEPSLRLALIDAVTEATEEINDELSTAEVTLSLSGGNPTFIVGERFVPPVDTYSLPGLDADDSDENDESGDFLAEGEDDADETLVRFSLRLPRWAKDKVDDRAAERGMSTNAYLTEVIISEIAGGWGRRGGERFGPGGPGPRPGFGGPGPRPGPGRGWGPGKGWGPGGFLDPEAASHIASILSEMFGQEPRRRGPGTRRPGAVHRDEPDERGRGGHHGRGPRDPEDTPNDDD